MGGTLPRRTHALGQGADGTAGVRRPAPGIGAGKEMEGLPALPRDRKGRQSDRPGRTNQIFKHGDLPFLGPWRLWGDWSHNRCAVRRVFRVSFGFWAQKCLKTLFAFSGNPSPPIAGPAPIHSLVPKGTLLLSAMPLRNPAQLCFPGLPLLARSRRAIWPAVLCRTPMLRPNILSPHRRATDLQWM